MKEKKLIDSVSFALKKKKVKIKVKVKYYITIDANCLLKEDNKPYGIEVVKKTSNGDQEEYIHSNLYNSLSKTKSLITLLTENKVTPVICKDVIDDFNKDL